MSLSCYEWDVGVLQVEIEARLGVGKNKNWHKKWL